MLILHRKINEMFQQDRQLSSEIDRATRKETQCNSTRRSSWKAAAGILSTMGHLSHLDQVA